MYLPGPLIGGALLALSQGGSIGDWRTWVIWATGLGFLGGWHVLVGKRGERLHSIGRALAAPPASRLLRKKAGRYVLYFRSFADDLSVETMSIAQSSLEERLCQALDFIGPVMAIGKPGERLATPGAARLYVQDADWRQTAVQLMTRARLVFIRMSDSPGLRWEISTVLERVPPTKILIFFERGYSNEVRERLYRFLASSLKERGYQDLPETLGAAVFLCFPHSGASELLAPVQYIDPQDRKSGPQWDVEASLGPVYRRLLSRLPVRLGKYSRLVLVGGPALLALAIDQTAKLAMVTHLVPGSPITVVPSYVNLVLLRNSGLAFGLFSSHGEAFRFLFYVGVPLVVLAFLVRWATAVPAYGSVHLVLRRVGYGLFIGGLVGNVIDRIRTGSVIDFIDLHWHQVQFPAFNFADTSISLGLLLLLLAYLLKLLAGRVARSSA